MNWQNKEGDIKQILESQEFAFNPQDWEVAEKLLLLRKKRRKKRRLVIITLPVALLLALGVYYGANTVRRNTAVVENRQDKTSKINTEKNTGKENQAPVNKSRANDNTDYETGELPAVNNAAKNETEINKSITNAATVAENSTSKTLTAKNNLPAETKNHPVITGDKETGLKETESISPAENKENLPVTELQAAINNNNEETPSAGDADTSAQSTTNSEPEQEKAVTKKDKDKPEPVLRNKIGITLGGNYSRLLSVQRGKFAILPYLAINFGYVLNSKWQLGGGLAYSVVNGGGLQKRYSVSTHSFGETHTELTIQTRRLHYFELPVTARYNFNDKLFFIGGVNAAYLLDIKGNVNENTTGLFAKSSGYSQKASDYAGGLKNWDLQLQLGTEFKYKKQLYLGGLINGGMLDIGNNKYYSNTAFERNLRLQLYIRYEFWNF